MSLISSNSAILTNPDLIFLKDYWVLIAAAGTFIFFSIKGCWKLTKKISKIDGLDTDMNVIKRDVATIKGKISTVEKLLKNILNSNMTPTATGLMQSNSPLQLTEKGNNLLEDCGFKEIYQTNKESILSLVKRQNPKLKYEAQETSMSVIMDISNEEFMSPIKKYSFEHGLNLIDVLKVSSIFLRDEIIKELEISE